LIATFLFNPFPSLIAVDDLRMFVSMSPIFPLEESLTNTSVQKFTIEQKKMFFYARNDTIRKYPSWQKKAYCDKKT